MRGNRDRIVTSRHGVVAVLLLGLVLVVMAIPRLVSGTWAALTPAVHENGTIQTGENDAISLDYLGRSQAWSTSADFAVYQAFILQRSGAPEERGVLEAMLAASPLRPWHWLRLAELLAGDNLPGALAAWRMSIFTGRVHPAIMAQRMAFGLRFLGDMPDADRQLLEDQMRLAFILRPLAVAKVMAAPENARNREYYTAVISKLSDTDIDAIARIHALH